MVKYKYMNWDIDTHTIKIHIRPYINKYENMIKFKNKALKRDKFKCRCCGGIYSSHLYCSILYNKKKVNIDNIISCCKLCYMIYNCKYTYQKQLTLCWSKKKQKVIIKKTIDYIIKNKKIPLITEIDKNAKRLPITLIEYLDVLKGSKIPAEMHNYKIFVSPYFEIDFLKDYIDIDEFMFVDENVDEKKIHINDLLNNYDKSLKEYNMSQKEKTFIDNHFNLTNKIDYTYILSDSNILSDTIESTNTKIMKEYDKIIKNN